METIPGRVMIFGVFDRLDAGERNFVVQASAEGKDLIIAIATDEIARQFKGPVQHTEQERLESVRQLCPSAKVILGDLHDPLATVKRYRPSLVCLGYNQIGFSQDLARTFPEIKIKRLDSYQADAT